MNTFRLQVISDFHIEFHSSVAKYFNAIPFDHSCEIGIVAGDLGLLKYPQPLDAAFRRLADLYEDVLYVLGNHEFYGLSWDETYTKTNEMIQRFPNVHWLRAGKSFVYKGVKFLGDTMWFPPHQDMHYARRQINDFYQIKGLEPNCFDHSAALIQWLREASEPGCVVVTHHLPHPKSTHPRFAGLTSNCVFQNKDAVEIFTLENRPKVWIHGHTHDKIVYEENGVQVICNPIGYPSENKSLPGAAEPSVYAVTVGAKGVEAIDQVGKEGEKS